ncbi:hypothetical protein MAR_014651 [Mya arenaria]|uniref:Uncharacterized protein n=1 Tax=Mya arenaria TaxID=6604 RepID=A0ABY7FEX2_MYAAR|nr:hypothetical protein MAR_014651 [Mya arenaria]
MEDDVMRNKTKLRQSKIFVNVDLTRLNQQVFTAIRLKVQDEVKSVCTRNGRIILRRYDDNIAYAEYKDYKARLELPWPQKHRE